ncbi:MAG: hypothetical protein IKE16_10510 [Solobacterium sp.]|nr:hypothetical protein [Solobacterium sp.]
MVKKTIKSSTDSSFSGETSRTNTSQSERKLEKIRKEERIKSMDFPSLLREIREEHLDAFETAVAKALAETDFILSLRYSNYYANEDGYDEYPPHFTKTELRKELTEVRDDFFEMLFLVPIARGDYRFKTHLWFREQLDARVDGLSKYSHKRDDFGERILSECSEAAEILYRDLKARFPRERIQELIGRNQAYKEGLAKYQKSIQQEEELRQNVLNRIPVFYRDSFPEARNMRRTFIIHFGPTNSGKTHDAIEALKNARHGIYLAPLRLLAFEQHETLIQAGIPCSMITGEERILIAGSRVQSSTIEMLSLLEEYDIAVIDEAQLIADENRGGAWCSAMYGILAKEIHVCAAPEAEALLKRIAEDCGDDCQVVFHERLAELQISDQRFRFPEDVQNGDALICFSRKHVHAIAAELCQRKIAAGIIYGNLPYDVRHNEARRFACGETSVIVSTDAIGMGMNLPIRRVVFLEHRKFDGKQYRRLTASEMKQISGRAGRFGTYPVGTAAADDPGFLIQKLNEPVPEIKTATAGFPDSLIAVPGKLSKTMQVWQKLPCEELFRKADITDLIKLTKWCERHTSRKELILQFVKIPFDPENEQLLSLWEDLFLNFIHNKKSDIPSVLMEYFHPDNDAMEALEQQYSVLDLLYNYCERFDELYCDEIIEKKRMLSEKIMELLKKQPFRRRKCKYCGSCLPWNYRYSMCSQCHSQRYPRRRYWEDGIYDCSLDDETFPD